MLLIFIFSELLFVASLFFWGPLLAKILAAIFGVIRCSQCYGKW